MPRPLSRCPPDAHKRAARLYFDVDDTLTWRGLLPEPALAALYRARELGLSLVAVTGRSAAWAEMMLRVLPLDAAIAETGALCFYREGGAAGGGPCRVLHSEPDEGKREANAARRRALAARVLAEVEGARLAVDNLGRLYDTAFDLVEDGPPVPESVAARIRALVEEEGITWAQSSVHINAWIGEFDKAWMVDRYLREVEGTSLAQAAPRMVYVGDSTNDGAMFAATPLSVGVGNVAPHLDRLSARGQAPAFVVEGKGGHGFAEVVEALARAR